MVIPIPADELFRGADTKGSGTHKRKTERLRQHQARQHQARLLAQGGEPDRVTPIACIRDDTATAYVREDDAEMVEVLRTNMSTGLH
jgi:hypothetical protein